MPFEVRGEFARADTKAGRRSVKGAFYRVVEKSDDSKDLEYRSGEKRERLIVEGQDYGEFSLHVFVFKEAGSVGNYLDPRHPVLLTHHGKLVFEFSRKLFSRALLPELSTRLFVEVRLDYLCDAAIQRLSREFNQQQRDRELLNEIQTILVWLLGEDDDLRQLEAIAAEETSAGASLETSAQMTEFLATFAQ